jgi:hypothetical protein
LRLTSCRAESAALCLPLRRQVWSAPGGFLALYCEGWGWHRGVGACQVMAAGWWPVRWRSVPAGSKAPVIHPVALGGPECRAVLGGSIKWAAVLC